MTTPLAQRLANFRQNFKKVLGPKRQGYGELSQLEQPLVDDGEEGPQSGSQSEYTRRHGVSPPAQSQGPGRQTGLVTGTAADVPSQVSAFLGNWALAQETF